MRISSVTLLSLAGLFNIAHGESDFNKLRSIIDRLESDAQELTNAYDDKCDEVTLLTEMITACQQGCSSEAPCSTSDSADTDDSPDWDTEPDSSSPDSTSEGTGGDEYGDEDDDATDDFTTHGNSSSTTTVDYTTTTTTSTSTSDDSAPSPGPSSGWVPRVGDTWNYNLATPVDTDIDADVFVIDMGRNRQTVLINCILMNCTILVDLYCVYRSVVST